MRLPITIASSRMKASEFTTPRPLMRLLATAENNYWEVINARENLGVEQENLELNDDRSSGRRRNSNSAPSRRWISIIRRPILRSAEIQVSQARFQLAQAEDALRRQICGRPGPGGPQTATSGLTESVLPPADD